MRKIMEKFRRPGLAVAALVGVIALAGCAGSGEAAPEETPTATEQAVTVVDTVDVDGQTTVNIFSSGSAEIATQGYGKDYLSMGAMPVFLTCIGNTLVTIPESYYGDTGSGATLTPDSPLCTDSALTRQDFEAVG